MKMGRAEKVWKNLKVAILLHRPTRGNQNVSEIFWSAHEN